MILRWFPDGADRVPLEYIRQVPGVSGVAACLMHIPVGETWPLEDINDLRDKIAAVGLERSEIERGPETARHAMSVVCALMLHRYKSGGAPIALVSMDNCRRNGELLQTSVMSIARGWIKNGFADEGLNNYLCDPDRVSFPWSMIDKITPRPAQSILEQLTEMGIAGLEPITTSKGTFIAPFVNAEVTQYLIIEDKFPNGRPPFKLAGVFMTDRETVNRAEHMKVMTCLNPLHTAMAAFGCLLGHSTASSFPSGDQTIFRAEPFPYVPRSIA